MVITLPKVYNNFKTCERLIYGYIHYISNPFYKPVLKIATNYPRL